jgi:hypothetical protein
MIQYTVYEKSALCAYCIYIILYIFIHLDYFGPYLSRTRGKVFDYRPKEQDIKQPPSPKPVNKKKNIWVYQLMHNTHYNNLFSYHMHLAYVHDTFCISMGKSRFSYIVYRLLRAFLPVCISKSLFLFGGRDLNEKAVIGSRWSIWTVQICLMTLIGRKRHPFSFMDVKYVVLNIKSTMFYTM